MFGYDKISSMEGYLKQTELLLNQLQSKKIFRNIVRYGELFYDEPKFFGYSALFNNPVKYLKDDGYLTSTKDVSVSGLSYQSKYLALLTCLSEGIERLSLFSYKKDSIIFASYLDLQKSNKKVLDLSLYQNSNHKEKIGWVWGYNFTKATRCLVPAQLIYLNYQSNNETQLSPFISTGAACHSDFRTALLHGIYEVVERDAVMSIYLNSIKAPLIDIEKLNIRTVKKLMQTFQKYKLDVYLINLTNDLLIPSFAAIIIDRVSGSLPAISVGSKSNFNIEKAIVGSIEEAFSERLWLKNIIRNNQSHHLSIDSYSISTRIGRALFWSFPDKIKYLNFLLNQPTKSFILPSQPNQKYELSKLRELFLKRKMDIYYVDISLDNFKKLGYVVYKIFIPGLQPLYLTSKEGPTRFGFDRLKTVSKYFGQKRFFLNKIPHPFI